MKDLKFAILGAGTSGFAMASDLTLGGYEVSLFEMEKYKDNIEPIIERGGIEHSGIPSVPGRTGFAEISTITTDIVEAIEGTDVVVLCLPASRHEEVMNLIAPHLKDGQMILFDTDNWGSIRLRKLLREAENKVDIITAGMPSALHAGRRVTPTRVWVRRVKTNMRVAAFPKEGTPKIVKTLSEVWPSRILAGNNILEIALTNPCTVTHPGLMIYNACRIESDKGMFNIITQGGQDLNAEGVSVKSPIKLLNKLTMEQKSVLEGWGLQSEFPSNYPPGHQKARLTDQELEEYAKIEVPGIANASPNYAPRTFNTRYLTEDIPFGLVPLHHFASLVDVSTPYTDATVTLGGLLLDKDYWKEGITPKELGWGGLTSPQILNQI